MAPGFDHLEKLRLSGIILYDEQPVSSLLFPDLFYYPGVPQAMDDQTPIRSYKRMASMSCADTTLSYLDCSASFLLTLPDSFDRRTSADVCSNFSILLRGGRDEEWEWDSSWWRLPTVHSSLVNRWAEFRCLQEVRREQAVFLFVERREHPKSMVQQVQQGEG